MQTERVTFLTNRDHKAALDAFASRRGESVSNVLRDASVKYMAESRDEEAELAALVEEVNQAIPRMRASLDEMSQSLRDAHSEIDRTLRAAGIRK